LAARRQISAGFFGGLGGEIYHFRWILRPGEAMLYA
jgi:hypothetical protein